MRENLIRRLATTLRIVKLYKYLQKKGENVFMEARLFPRGRRTKTLVGFLEEQSAEWMAKAVLPCAMLKHFSL